MENKLLSRILFGFVAIIFVVSIYFFIGMSVNGHPDSYKADQMGIELVDKGEATTANFMEKGVEARDKKVKSIEATILNGIGFMQILLWIAGILMVLFLVLSTVMTAVNNPKKAIPSGIFIAITVITFIYAFANSGSDTEGFSGVTPEVMSTTNFWVSGFILILIVGGAIFLVSLLWDIIKGFAK